LLAAAAVGELAGDHGGEPELLHQLGNDTNRTLVVAGNEKRKTLLARQVRSAALMLNAQTGRTPRVMRRDT
jgi:hypothetical protein